jgi:hypothetical protein
LCLFKDPYNPEISLGSEFWWEKFKYPWWAQLFSAALVLMSVIPIPYYFIKNWPKGGFSKIKTALSDPAIFYPDPSWKEPERRLGMKEMEELIRKEDRENLRMNLEDARSTSLKA